MCSFINRFLYKTILRGYMKDFQIPSGSQEAEEIREMMERIIANPEGRKESEIFIVVLSATAIKIEKEKEKKEELITGGIEWLCASSPLIVGMYVLRDVRALDISGVKEVFKEKLKKYCF
jgi:hypothetical protein